MSLGRIAVVALVRFTHASGIVAFGEFLLSYILFFVRYEFSMIFR